MKKVCMFVLILIIPFCIFAASDFPLGISLSVGGNTQARTFADAGICFRPFDSSFMNPEFRLGTGVSYSAGGFEFNGVNAGVEIELFRTMKNPLQFTLINPGPWSPSVMLGVNYSKGSTVFKAELSLFRTLDKDFIYEWFIVGGDFTKAGFENWAVSFIRITALF